MANGIFDVARKYFAEGKIKWGTNTGAYNNANGHTWKIALFDTAPNQGSALTMSTLLASATTVGAMTTITNVGADYHMRSVASITWPGTPVESNGACIADAITFSNVTASPTYDINGLLIYLEDTGTPANSIPVIWLDSATGLPIVPNGGNIIVTWDSGVNKIFRL